MKRAIALLLVSATTSFPALASDTGGASGTAPAASNGSSQGAGFDVTGSHPLPNAGEQEAPGRGACGCGLTGAPVPASTLVGIAALAVAMAGRKRRTVA